LRCHMTVMLVIAHHSQFRNSFASTFRLVGKFVALPTPLLLEIIFLFGLFGFASGFFSSSINSITGGSDECCFQDYHGSYKRVWLGVNCLCICRTETIHYHVGRRKRLGFWPFAACSNTVPGTRTCTSSVPVRSDAVRYVCGVRETSCTRPSVLEIPCQFHFDMIDIFDYIFNTNYRSCNKCNSLLHRYKSWFRPLPNYCRAHSPNQSNRNSHEGLIQLDSSASPDHGESRQSENWCLWWSKANMDENRTNTNFVTKEPSSSLT
jgi:hypothetical protein